jgi:hypothetical protein
MPYYDHRQWLDDQEIEIKRRREEQQKKWLKEQKNIVLGEIKQLKGNPGDLNKVYTKKEIAASKKADLKEIKAEIMAQRKVELKWEKEDFEHTVEYHKEQITQSKNDYNKTKKRLSKISKGDLDLIKEELNKKWEKQWGKSQKGTRKK